MIVKQNKMDKRVNYTTNLETIFASASSMGISAIKTIRISGKESGKILKLLTKKHLPKPRYHSLKKIYDIKNLSLIDKAVIVWLPGPKTYTGEDMVEFHIHGGNAVLEHLIKNLSFMKNVRLAKPGEFTKRAFINNKMDLLKAEAVMDLINAETETQKKIAMQQIEGKLSEIFNNWNNRLTKMLAHYEAQIDFPEDGIPKKVENKVIKEINTLRNELKVFLSDNRDGEIIRNGIEIVIIGAPNVGKSTLINQLARRDVALTSHVPGTTRDIIDIKLNISNIPVIFFDTAGIKKRTQNLIEKKGILKAREKMKKSDLKILLIDATKKINSSSLELIDNKTIIVINKIDKVNEKKLFSKINELNKLSVKKKITISVSALKGFGINKLLKKIEKFIKKKYSNFLSGEPVIIKSRHRSAIKECMGYMNNINNKKNPELNAEELRLAVQSIGEITGKFDFEQLLDIVFKDFCIGK